MDMDDLKRFIGGAKNIAGYIDETKIIYDYKTTPLIFDWKKEGFKIEYILINDIFDWLCYLGLGDGIIAEQEVEFINECLDSNFTKDQIRKSAISKLNKDFKNHIPISFMLFLEAEIVDKNLMINGDLPIYSENLFRLFGVLGQLFISCDGIITDEEQNIYYEYLELLWQNLNDFKARRCIDDTYAHLVGKDVLDEDITVKTNLNEKTVEKMNLVLKLISQGYSLYDLNNIAYMSIEIIAKWFYLGRLGDESFEEFYMKCIKINPSFEMDIDEVIENIDIINVDDAIFNDKTDNSTSKSKNNKQKYLSKQKIHIFDLQIKKLNSHFLNTEKNTRKLIEKCFPAPQLTNDKFNAEVDECLELFNEKFDVVTLMLGSLDDFPVKLENEIKSNVVILREISNELDSLHEELLINMSKSGNNDFEIVFEEMGRLIDSVKYY